MSIGRFKLLDVYNDYSTGPVVGAWEFSTLEKAKIRANEIDKPHLQRIRQRGRTPPRLVWVARKGSEAEGVSKSWNGFHDWGKGRELAYRILEMQDKRRKNPLMNPSPPKGRFTKKHLADLQAIYAGIESIDPSGNAYPKLIANLDRLSQAQLKQLANARIKFISALARNRLSKRENDIVKASKRGRPKRNPRGTGYFVFRISKADNKTSYLRSLTGTGFQWGSRIAATLFPETKAEDLARFAAQRESDKFFYGRAAAKVTADELRKKATGKN